MIMWSCVTATANELCGFAFHVCMGDLCLPLEPKSIDIHEIPEPQYQVCIVNLTSLCTQYTEQFSTQNK